MQSWTQEDVSLVRMVADQLVRLLVWGWDELNLRAIADCFLAFGAEVDDNLTQVCRAAAVITGADVVLHASPWRRPRGAGGVERARRPAAR